MRRLGCTLRGGAQRNDFATMNPERSWARLALVCGALLWNGCAREAPFSADTETATRQANKLLPKGTSEAHATALLKEKGFQLSRLSSEAAADHLLVATHTAQNKTWLVGVIIVNRKVVACSVTISESS
jgi:hypothetical protein